MRSSALDNSYCMSVLHSLSTLADYMVAIFFRKCWATSLWLEFLENEVSDEGCLMAVHLSTNK